MKKRGAAVKNLLYAGDVVGVDLGTHTVKALRLRFNNGNVSLLDYEQREVWPRLAAAQNDEERRAVYAEALADIVSTRKLRGHGAAVSLPGNAVLLRTLKLPRKHRLDPETGIPDDAKPLIPFELRDARVDTVPQPTPDDAPQIELMLAIAEKRVVDDAVALVSSCGLHPTALVNDLIALEAAYAYFDAAGQEPVVLVNVGAATTSVSIIENGVSRGARVFNIAGNTFTRAIRRATNLDAEAAEGLKHSFGLAGADPASAAADETRARVFQALKAPVRDLCVELRRTVDHYADARPAGSPPVRRVLLAGGSARMRGLAEHMSAEIKLPVSVFRPLENATLRPSESRVEHLSPGMSVVAGLAAHNVLVSTRPDRRVNMIPRAARRVAVVKTLSPARGLLVFFFIVAGALSALYVTSRRRIAAAEAEAHARLEAARAQAALAAAPRKAAAAKPRQPPSPFAYLARLTVTGVVGDEAGATVMLTDPAGAAYAARGGRLFDAEDSEVAGVTTALVGTSLILRTVRNESFAVPLPK
jgi:type IV pilus assembly protein PilM